MSDLWTNAAQQYAAIGMNVTDTASLANSHLLKLQVGSVNRFTIDKSGNATGTSFYGNGTVSAPSIISNGSIVAGNSTGNAALFYDPANNSVAQFFGNVNNFIQVAINNINAGNNASTDLVVHDDLGLLEDNYIDIGINSTQFDQATWTINGPSDAYVYTGNTNLAVGTSGLSNLVFFTGGTLAVNERMRITSANTIIIANSSALVANGSNGTLGAVLQSNGTGVYWSNNIAMTTLTFANATSTAVVNVSTVAMGNTDANSVLTTNSILVQNATGNAGFTSPTTLRIANTSAGGLLTINVSTIALGNGGTSTANLVLTQSSLAVTNSTANIQIVNPANLFISTNTGFNLGTRTLAANGSSYLPNGLLANWGWVAANTTAGTITFTTPFTTACYIVQLTPALQASNNAYLTAAPSTTAAQVRNQSTLAAGSNVFYFALGL